MKELSTMQFSERQQKLTFPSEKRALLLLNERVLTIPASEEEGMEREEQTVYEYDGMFLDVSNPNEDSVLSAVKELKISDLMVYDSSEDVNQFTYQGVKMWLDKATRNGLLMRFNAEKAQGIEITTLWYDGIEYTLRVEDGISMLYAIELYASKSYDNTQKHMNAISELDTLEEVISYDYTVGYSDKLVL